MESGRADGGCACRVFADISRGHRETAGPPTHPLCNVQRIKITGVAKNCVQRFFSPPAAELRLIFSMRAVVARNESHDPAPDPELGRGGYACDRPAPPLPMNALDYIVLFGYFVAMAAIGLWAMRRIKGQEDYFLGGRAFGKVLQTFAAFGAGTGSSDPVNTARTTFTSGMSGIWSTMSWLFVTPFYWNVAVWFRRMRHMTLGDWFVERYESRPLGAAYTIFGLIFYMVYASMLFSAIGKVAAPLLGNTVLIGGNEVALEYVLVPVIAIIVILYGVLGGLTAAYWTDLIQGIFIILLSIMLVPFGLSALVAKFGNPETDGLMHGFRIIHEQLPASMFSIVGSTTASDFPLHRIIAVTVISLIGVVVQPHFIATGGGSAKTELNARVGLVAGNLAKRFCTIGWALTALIILALYADNPELVADPDKAWGVASRELLAPGLRGLMLACMLAALMSSADTYMLVSSGLVVRNLYAPYINAKGSEKEYVLVGRISGAIIIIGAVIVSWSMMNVFQQLQLTWIVPVVFAAPFWIGIVWRRATRAAAWTTMAYAVLVFFLIPWLAPVMFPGLRTNPAFTETNQIVTTISERPAAPADVRRRDGARASWAERRAQAGAITDAAARERALAALGPQPQPLAPGEALSERTTTGGVAIYWTGRVQPVGEPKFREISRQQTAYGEVIVQAYDSPLRATGNFNLDFLIYDLLGMDLTTRSNAMLATMELPPKIITPFLVMVLVSLFTRRNDRAALNRYYAKMRTPVDPDPRKDREELQRSFEQPDRFAHRKLFPKSDFEFLRPGWVDIGGFVLTFAMCFLIIGLAVWIARIGS
jgi:solute:Na+ symporter, SSS family